MIIPHLTEHLHSSQNWSRDFVLIKLVLHFLTKLWQCFAFRALFYGLKLGNSVWWKKVQIYRLKVVGNKMSLVIVNQKSNMSPCRSQFTVKLLDPLLEQHATHAALPLTSKPTGKLFYIFETVKIHYLPNDKH